MNDVLLSALIGTAVGGVGTALGACCAIPFRNSKRKKLPGILMSIAGGIMIAIALFHMMPEAYEHAGAGYMMLGAAAGAVFVAILHKLLPEDHHHHHNEPHAQMLSDTHDKRRILHAGLLLCAGVAIHNLPQGLAIGSGIASHDHYGFSLALLLVFHNLSLIHI